MNTLEVMEKLTELQKTKEDLEYTIKHTDSFYHESTTISISLDTKDYDYDRGQRHIKVTNLIFSKYLQEELESINLAIKTLVEDLSNSI